MAKSPEAKVEITANNRTFLQRLRETRVKAVGFASELRNNIFGKDLVKNGFLSKAGANMVGNLGARGFTAVGDAVMQNAKNIFDFNDALKRLQITANATPEEMNAFAASIRRSSSAVGIDAKQILDGAQAYVALTGDMKGATAATDQWARVAQATGSQVTDIAQTAAALKQQMNIKPEQMEQTFAALTAQGKAGAIELKDLAAQLSSIAPQWAEFAGGKGVEGVKQLGAALQVVKRGFGGDASETVTGLQSLLNAYVKNAARLQKGGVKVFDKDPKTGEKALRNVLDITNDLANSKLAKDPTKLEKALGRVEAYRAYLQLKNNRAELDKLVIAAGDAGIIQRDLDTYMQSSAGRTKSAWESAKNEIAEAFTPERIESLTTAMVAATKVAAGLGIAVAGIVSGVEAAGRGFAKLLGNETEDDKASRMTQDQRNARILDVGEAMANADPFDDNYGFGKETPIEYANRIRAQATAKIDAEDAKANAIAANAQNGVPFSPTIGADFPMQPGPLAAPKGRRPMTKDELQIMQVQAVASGDSNTGTQLAVLARAIENLAKSQAALNSQLVGQSKAPVNFSIGSDPVMTATRNAPQNARRPGE